MIYLKARLDTLKRAAIIYGTRSDEHMKGISDGIAVAVAFLSGKGSDAVIEDVLKERKKR